MNELSLFTFNENIIRTAISMEKPFFCIKDVCRALDIKNHNEIVKYLKTEGVASIYLFDINGKLQPFKCCDEKNLYRIIIRSRKKEAVKFQDWITDEVLPSIMRSGSYNARGYNEKAPVFRLPEKIEIKVKMYDRFMTAENVQNVAEVAKCLKVGPNKLFEFLRKKRVFFIKHHHNYPYQRFIDRGFFRVIEFNRNRINYAAPRVTPKGVEFIAKLINHASPEEMRLLKSA